MKIRVLGAHNCEAGHFRFPCVLVDDCIALDAGGLTSSLSFSAQQELIALLLTHPHYDHIRDVPAMAMNLFLRDKSIDIYATQAVHETLISHLMDGKLYPNFFQQPPENPTLRFTAMEHGQTQKIGDYTITAVAVNHSLPATGFQITSPDGKSVFFTGDTGAGLAECWNHVTPGLLIIEVSMPDSHKSWATQTKHLTPGLLKQELASFRKSKKYLPHILTIHMNPQFEVQIKKELAIIARELRCSIRMGYEGVVIRF